jgi:hypothetical protein
MVTSSRATRRPMAVKIHPRPRLAWPGRTALLVSVSLVAVCILLALALVLIR